MSHVGQRLQDVVGHGKQEVGGKQPAEAEDTVAHWERNRKKPGAKRQSSEHLCVCVCQRLMVGVGVVVAVRIGVRVGDGVGLAHDYGEQFNLHFYIKKKNVYSII